MRWTVHSEELLYADEWLDIRLADVELPGGRAGKRPRIDLFRFSVVIAAESRNKSAGLRLRRLRGHF